MKRAAAYLRRNRIITHPESVTVDGVGIVSQPVFELASHDVVDLGAAILEALQHSRDDVPHPAQAEWGKIGEPVLKAAKVKSWRTFATSAKYVHVRLETNRVVFTPTENLGPRGGFADLPAKERSCVPAAADVGAALLAAFEDAV